MMNTCRGLLLSLLSFCVVAAHGQKLNNPNKRGPLNTQVNTLSGNLFIPRTDIVIPARGFNIDISFHYNSFLFTEDYGYGKGWTFQYNIKYSRDTLPGARLILWGDGREDKYDSLPGGGYTAPKGFFTTLSQYQPGKYVLTEQNGVKYYFDNAVHKRITRMEEPNGNFISFTYTDSLLSALSTTAGQSISFTYNAQGRLATVVDAVATPSRTFMYTYDAAGNLKEVKDPLNGKCQYTYLVNGPMQSLSDKNNNKVDIIYFPDLSVRELVGCNKRLSFSYDAFTQTTVVTDHLATGNQVTKYTYKTVDGLSWITSMSGNCCGFNISYEYDDQGNMTKMTDANGQVYTFTYDAFGNRLTATDPLGQVSSYTYTTDFKKIKSFRDPKGNLYTLNYDGNGNLVQLITPGNNSYAATYNAAGDIITSTDPKGNGYTYHYDAVGNPVNVTGPHGYTAALSFDARGNLLSYTDAGGHNSTAEYDILNRLKKITDPLNNNVQYNYDAAGNVLSVVNKNNEISTLSYDAGNRLVKSTGSTGNQSGFTYDGMNNVLAAKNALGHEVKMSYDNRNRLKTISDAENNNTVFTYDGNGNMTAISLPNGRSLAYTYDHLNRLTSVADATSQLAAFGYDNNGNVTSYTNATGASIRAQYDSLNRVTQIMDPLGNTSSRVYDKNNNIIAVTDREGQTSQYTYDSLNRVKTYTDNNGFVLRVGYDAQSNILSLTDPNNNSTTYTYDELNRRTRMTYPDGKYMTYTYDTKNNLTSLRRTDATVVTYQYDTLNRVVSRTLPGGEVYRFTYDKLNRVLTATNDNGTVAFTYDALNRVTSESYDGRTISYNYSIAGRSQTTVYPDGMTVKKEFDTRDRLTKIVKDNVTVSAYAYNNANQLTTKTFANGISTSLQYDFANRLSSITTGTLQNTSFTYDKMMNKTAINRPNTPALSEQFTYDHGYRLTNYKRGAPGSPVIQNTYTYDAAGNRTAANLNGVATAYNINNLNQLTSVNSTSFTFDDRGNMTFDGTFFKTYDAENRLIKDSSSPVSVITYGYDALNRRITKTMNGNLLKYTYSGSSPIEERSSGNIVLNRTVFIHFLAPVLNEKNGNSYYYHPNELGSVEAISNSNGRLIESYRYDVYGKLSRYDSLNNPLASSVAGNRFGFTGQEYDSASGHYRFFFRNYSPETGVFNQRDLIEYQDGMSMYQYVGNNPANGVDILGLEESFPCANLTKEDKKIRIISRNLIVQQQDKVVSEANQEGFKQWWVVGRIAAGVMADSKFYSDVSSSSGAVGGEQYYFDGQVMANYDVNYYFTAYANASRGWSNISIDAQTTAWNLGKGAGTVAKDIVISPFTGKMPGSEPLMSKYREIPLKMDMSQKGFDDYYANTRIENLVMKDIPIEYQYKQVGYGEWWPVFNPQTGDVTYEFFLNKDLVNDYAQNEVIRNKINKYLSQNPCPPTAGTKKNRPKGNEEEETMNVNKAIDPNEIIGPSGQPDKKWVAVKDRMPYTILFENDSTATARARFIRITSPVEPKQDPATLELGQVGFNNQSFDIPQGRSFYYQRLDARDSTGVFVDLTAGYDVVNNQLFWEFQAVDPVTLLPPEDPLAGFLFLHDSTQENYGNGFVNFSIKPRLDAQTGDTTGARAFIVFDENDVIPTNIFTNTIDAVAPVSQLNTVTVHNATFTLNWTGADDPGGSGIAYYTVYVSTDQVNYSVLFPVVKGTDTTFTLVTNTDYCFFVLATDRVGQTELFRPGSSRCASGTGTLPLTWLYFNGTNQGKNNLLNWATTHEQNSKEFRLERSLNGASFSEIAVLPAAGNSPVNQYYSYTDRRIDLLNSNVMFYRLKQVDLDNQFRYSSIVRLPYRQNNASPTIVYPNPTGGMVTIVLGDISLVGTEAVLMDVNGRLLQKIKLTAGSQTISLKDYINGVYLIRLHNKETLKVVKQ